MKILKIDGDKAVVSAGKIKRRIAINFLNRPEVGDYVIVHAGFAIEKIDPGEAQKTLRMLNEVMP